MPTGNAFLYQLRKISRTVILVIAAFWFGFSLLSGAEDYGGGFQGLLSNSPNALPWFFLLLFVFMYQYYPLVSAILIAITGMVILLFYGALRSPVVLFAVTLPVIVAGLTLLTTTLLARKNQGE